MMDKNITNMIKVLSQYKDLFIKYLDLKNIHYQNYSENNIRMDSLGSDNRNGLSVDLDKMFYYDFKTGEKGTVIELLSKILNINYRLILVELQNLINNNIENLSLDNTKENKEIVPTKKELISYPEKLLDLYPLTISEIFEKDGILPSTQILFGIRYEKESNRILIPVYFKDNLVGIIGRLNQTEVPKGVAKYLPLLHYPKSEMLFGYDLNKDYIKALDFVILVESEKSVMKAFQNDIHNVLAVGGSNISKSQIKILEELGISKVIVSFDSDKDKEKMIKDCKKWFKGSKLKVYFNNTNTELVESKSSIFDMKWTKDYLAKYINNYTERVICE